MKPFKVKGNQRVIKVEQTGNISWAYIPSEELNNEYEYTKCYGCYNYNYGIDISDDVYKDMYDAYTTMYIGNKIKNASNLIVNTFATFLMKEIIFGDVYIGNFYFDDKNVEEDDKQKEYEQLSKQIQIMQSEYNKQEFWNTILNRERKPIPTIVSARKIKEIINKPTWINHTEYKDYALRSATSHDIELCRENAFYLSRSFDYESLSEKYKKRPNKYSYKNLLEAYKNEEIKKFNGTVGIMLYDDCIQRDIKEYYEMLMEEYPSEYCLLITGNFVDYAKPNSDKIILSCNELSGAYVVAKIILDV